MAGVDSLLRSEKDGLLPPLGQSQTVGEFIIVTTPLTPPRPPYPTVLLLSHRLHSTYPWERVAALFPSHTYLCHLLTHTYLGTYP